LFDRQSSLLKKMFNSAHGHGQISRDRRMFNH
jgi:hypothetical protein